MKKNSKRYKELQKNSKNFKSNDIKEILEIVKKNSTAKFDESIDISLRIGLKQSKGGDFNLRTVTQLPAGTGKKIKVAVLCEPDKTEEANKCGADIVGSEDLIEKIAAGKFEFDKLICTPGMMSKVGKYGKILGPKGLMPNPKLGTVTNDIKSTIKALKAGQIEIKNDEDGNLGASIGKKSFADNKIKENFDSLLQAISKEKPSGIKGNFIQSAFLTSTMGVSYKLKLANKLWLIKLKKKYT